MSDSQEWLRRGVLDLSIMLRGIDAELDGALEQLKKTLKQRDSLDEEAFRLALEQTDERFDRIEGIAEAGTGHLYRLYASLMALQPEQASTAFRQEVETASGYLYNALSLAEEALRLVPAEAGDGPDEDGLRRLRQKLCSRFITLLRTLAILGDEDGALRSLAQRLEPLPDWAELDDLASETISLIQHRLDAEKGQFQYYLNQLNDKLRSINELISQNHQAVSDLTRLNDDLDQRVEQQLDRAREAISDAVNIEQLRSTLNDSLDGLIILLGDFQAYTRDSLSAMNRRQDELGGHLSSLQEDNHRLIKQVAHEREMSMRDPLTQLPNRQGFDQRMNEEMARSNRYRQPVSIALVDVDHFKRINDHFGHLAGDRVLKILAKEMHSQVRQTDYLARFGGEEFIVLLPQTDLDNAEAAVEKMREHISRCPFHFQDNPVQITISAGVAAFRSGESADQWLHRADKALYQSKDNGRNRTSRSE